MKRLQMFKGIIDIVMVMLLPVMMQYTLTGQETHEWLGIVMTALFILHHVLNYSWPGSLFRGKYTPVRSYITAINILLFLDMLLLAGSGIIMSGISGYAFEFLHLDGDMELMKRFHRFGAYWGFLLMSVHLGQHWNYVNGMVKKVLPMKVRPERLVWLVRGLIILTVIYGLIAFFRQNMAGYLFLKTAAVYFDEGKAQIIYLWDCVAMIGLFAVIGYRIRKVLIPGRSEKHDRNGGKTI